MLLTLLMLDVPQVDFRNAGLQIGKPTIDHRLLEGLLFRGNDRLAQRIYLSGRLTFDRTHFDFDFSLFRHLLLLHLLVSNSYGRFCACPSEFALRHRY